MRSNNYFRFMMILWTLAVLVRGINLTLMFTGTRKFYVILMESFKDAIPFLSMIVYICAALALANSMLLIGEEKTTSLFE